MCSAKRLAVISFVVPQQFFGKKAPDEFTLASFRAEKILKNKKLSFR